MFNAKLALRALLIALGIGVAIEYLPTAFKTSEDKPQVYTLENISKKIKQAYKKEKVEHITHYSQIKQVVEPTYEKRFGKIKSNGGEMCSKTRFKAKVGVRRIRDKSHMTYDIYGFSDIDEKKFYLKETDPMSAIYGAYYELINCNNKPKFKNNSDLKGYIASETMAKLGAEVLFTETCSLANADFEIFTDDSATFMLICDEVRDRMKKEHGGAWPAFQYMQKAPVDSLPITDKDVEKAKNSLAYDFKLASRS